jgi:hypothetical protein
MDLFPFTPPSRNHERPSSLSMIARTDRDGLMRDERLRRGPVNQLWMEITGVSSERSRLAYA